MLPVPVKLNGKIIPFPPGINIPRLHSTPDPQILQKVNMVNAVFAADLSGLIRRPVVDDYIVKGIIAPLSIGAYPLNDFLNVFFLIIGRNN